MAPLWLLIVERRVGNGQKAVSEYHDESLQDFVSEMLSEAGPAGQIDLEIQVREASNPKFRSVPRFLAYY